MWPLRPVPESEIDSAPHPDGLLVSGAVFFTIVGDCAIGDMNVARIGVYVEKKCSCMAW
jgi:hypothetical protein